MIFVRHTMVDYSYMCCTCTVCGYMYSVCVCVHVCAHVCVCVHVCVHAQAHMCEQVCMCFCMISRKQSWIILGIVYNQGKVNSLQAFEHFPCVTFTNKIYILKLFCRIYEVYIL